jgi:hypothetical protein
MSQFFRPQELRFPDAEYPDSLRISDTCLPKRMAQIIPGNSPWKFPISCSRECRYPDVPKYRWALDLRHVSPPTDGPDLPGVSRLEVSRFSSPRESRYTDGCYPDGYASRRDFTLVVPDGLTTVHLPVNPMADGYLLKIWRPRSFLLCAYSRG